MSRPLLLSSLSSLLLLSSCITLVQSDGGGGGAGGGGAAGGSSGGAGGGVGTEGKGTNSSNIDVNGYAAHASVGTQGGSVTMPGGPTLDAPSGALPGATGFGLGSAKQSPALPSGTTAVSPWYELVSDKNDLTGLTKPLTLSVPIQLPSGASATHPGLRVLATAGSGTLVPIEGKLDAATGKFKVALPGAPPKLTFAVTFTPTVARMTSDEIPETPPPPPPAPPPAGWSTVSWTLSYDAQVITKLQATKVLFYARRAAREYSNAGLREPSLVQEVDGTTKRWVVHLTADGSKFQGGDWNAVGEDALGRLYVDTGRIDDPKTRDLGSVYASVAHEMYHSVFDAYRIPGACFNYEQDGVQYCYRSATGFNEGMATAVGYYLDQGAANPRPSEPFQRVTFPLGYFSSSARSAAYGNQDFFVYQLRVLGLAAFGKQMEGLRSAAPDGSSSLEALVGYHTALESTADGWPDGPRAGHLQYVYQRVYAREKGPLWSAEPRDAKAAKYSIDKALFGGFAVAKVEQKHCKVLVDGVTCEIDVEGHSMAASRVDIDMKTDGSSLPPGYKPNEVQGTFKVTADGGSVAFFVVAQKAGVGTAESVALSPTGGDVTLAGLNSKYDEVVLVAVPFGKGTSKVHLKLDVKPQTLSAACAAASKWMCTCQPGGNQPCWVWDLAVQQGCESGPSCDEWCNQTSASYAAAAKDSETWAAMGCTAGP
ncbi:MAG: hypothetical protein IT374_25620 [Polyangiaceae bacterium]|nr:hypothetical protein [Polyangiaceae bacterium]